MSEDNSEIPKAFTKDLNPSREEISDTFGEQMSNSTKRYIDYKDNPDLISIDYPALKGHEKEVLKATRKAATEERPQMAGMYPQTEEGVPPGKLFQWYADHEKEKIAKSHDKSSAKESAEEEWDSPEEREKQWKNAYNQGIADFRTPPPTSKPKEPPKPKK